MACAVAALVAGCSTTRDDALGGTDRDTQIYEGTGESTIDGLNRGVNTNWFGPVGSGVSGVGTPSGSFDHNQR